MAGTSDKKSSGGSTSSTRSPSPSKSASASDGDVIAGLRGQTAAQRTCSIAAR